MAREDEPFDPPFSRLVAAGLWDLLRHPIASWRSSQAVSEHFEAVQADHAAFSRERGLDPKDPALFDQYEAAVDQLIDVFSAVRGLDPEDDRTLDAFADAHETFARACEREGAPRFEAASFRAWLEGPSGSPTR